MNTGTSLRTTGVQRGHCPRKEGNVTDAPAHDQQQYAKSRRLARTKDAENEDEWTKDPNGVTERMTGPNGVYIRYVSAPADDEEWDYAVRAGKIFTST